MSSSEQLRQDHEERFDRCTAPGCNGEYPIVATFPGDPPRPALCGDCLNDGFRHCEACGEVTRALNFHCQDERDGYDIRWSRYSTDGGLRCRDCGATPLASEIAIHEAVAHGAAA